MITSLSKQGFEFYRWSQRNPIGEIPTNVAKEGAGENRIPFMHYANSIPVYLTFAEILKNDKKKTVSVLDLGCGTGRNISFVKSVVKKNGYEYFGIDYSSACIAYAQLQYRKHGVTFVKHNGKILPFPAHTFDFIVSSHVLEHIAKKDADTYVCEIARILKSGGIAVIGTPNRTHCQDLFYTNPSENKKYRFVLPHLHEYYYDEIKTLFKKHHLFNKVEILQTTNNICHKLMEKGADAIKPKRGFFHKIKFEIYTLLRQNSMLQDFMARLGGRWILHGMKTNYKDLLKATTVTQVHPEEGDNFIVIAKK